MLWSFLGALVFFFKPEYRAWLVPLHLLFDLDHIFALLWQAILFAAVGICAVHCVSQQLSRATSTFTDSVDYAPWRSRIVINFDDNMRYDTLDLLLMVCPSSISSDFAHGIPMGVCLYSWGLCGLSISAPFIHSPSICNTFNLCCDTLNLPPCTISGSFETDHGIFSPH